MDANVSPLSNNTELLYPRVIFESNGSVPSSGVRVVIELALVPNSGRASVTTSIQGFRDLVISKYQDHLVSRSGTIAYIEKTTMFTSKRKFLGSPHLS